LENTMNFSTFSREQLEDELLGNLERLPQRAQCRDAAATDYAGRDSATGKTVRHRLAVARELLLRDASNELIGRALIDTPQAAHDYLRLHFATLEREVFVVLMLDAQHRVLGIEEMFRGTLTHTSVYPREVVRAALACNAGAVLFAHNHPSGHAEPSRSDELLTHTLKSALALVDVRVLDHVVFAAGLSVSMAERGLL
jgi:DNA repair protein RadC